MFSGNWDRKNRVALFGKDNPVRGKLSSAGFGLRPKLAVTGIPQAGHDVAILIEMVINRRQVDWHIGMGFVQALDAFRRADQPNET